MRTFVLSPPVKAWLDGLVAAHPDAPAPPLPPPASDPEEVAFYNAFLIPIAALKGQVVALVPLPGYSLPGSTIVYGSPEEAAAALAYANFSAP